MINKGASILGSILGNGCFKQLEKRLKTLESVGARGRNRTGTSRRTTDFKSPVQSINYNTLLPSILGKTPYFTRFISNIYLSILGSFSALSGGKSCAI